MNYYWLQIIWNRFLKGALAGGVASMILVLSTQPLVFGDWRNYLAALTIAFLTGFALAIEKALQGYHPEEH